MLNPDNLQVRQSQCSARNIPNKILLVKSERNISYLARKDTEFAAVRQAKPPLLPVVSIPAKVWSHSPRGVQHSQAMGFGEAMNMVVPFLPPGSAGTCSFMGTHEGPEVQPALAVAPWWWVSLDISTLTGWGTALQALPRIFPFHLLPLPMLSSVLVEESITVTWTVTGERGIEVF